MKKNVLKRLAALGLSAVMVMGCLVGCGNQTTETKAPETQAAAAETQAAAPTETQAPAEGEAATAGGTIMWLSNLSSGPQYDANMAYAEMICKELGYEWKVVYGDMFNDPTGNLNAVKNAMTKDVVAIISSQDGGINNIMEEYPDLYVAGYNTDMAAVYSEGGAAAALQNNEKFLGTIVDGYADGTLVGKDYFDVVVEQGYKKVATIIFPAYAYPMLAVADATFREEVAKYNETAEEPIEIVGEVKVLEFSPLDESWFMEGDNSQLDCIVGMCAGAQFIYPTMKSAMANGLCSENTKLITSGFESAEDILADMGGEGVIQHVNISPLENIAWSIVMIDNALNGKMYADFPGAAGARIDSARFVIETREDVENVINKSMCVDSDPTKALLTIDDLKTVLTRYNESATFEDLNALFHSEKVTVANLANK